MNQTPSCVAVLSLGILSFLPLVNGCDSPAKGTQGGLRADAGSQTDAQAVASTVTPSATELFDEVPSVQVPGTALSASASPLPSGYMGPTAEHPIEVCSTARGTGEAPLLDDFEDGDEYTLSTDGRSGGWYYYDDGTGGVRNNAVTADPSAGRAGEVLKVTGANFSDWGSGFGAGLAWGSGQCWYDASHYAGIRFWARGEGKVRVALQNPGVRPVSMGGACPDADRCFDSHGVDIQLSATWAPYEFTFEEFTQAGWGESVGALDPSHIYILEFQFGAVKPYEMWLDDVAFFAAGDPPLVGLDSGVADTGVIDSGVPGTSSDGGRADSGGIRTDSGTTGAASDASALTQDSGAADASVRDD
jgi:Carbohydrate binding domain (family 11)